MAFPLTGIQNANDFFSQHYLDEVLDTDLKDLYARWQEQDSSAPPSRLRAMAGDYFRLRERLSKARTLTDQLPLLQAGISASWTRSDVAEKRNREALKPVQTLVSDTLRRGVERGELSQRADLRLIAGVLWDVYLAGYCRAVFDGWTADDLTSRLSDQINLILAGARS